MLRSAFGAREFDIMDTEPDYFEENNGVFDVAKGLKL